MSQIFLFTGENSYALLQEKQRWIKQFAEKHGEENLSRISTKNMKVREFYDEVAVSPFIAPKRLVVAEGIPAFSKEEVQKLQDIMHPDVILAFVEAKPDKRLSAVKEILKTADVKEFAPLTGAKLRTWMMHYANMHGLQLSEDSINTLLHTVGEDQGMLATELEKLGLCLQGKVATKADVIRLVIPSGEQVVWHLLDLLGAGKPEEALRFAHVLLERGESPHSLWARMLWMMQNLVSVCSAVQEGNTNPMSICKDTGVPFMSVKSMLPLARKLDMKKLRAIIEETVAADIDLKTGGYKATAEAPEELNALIDRCIFSLQA